VRGRGEGAGGALRRGRLPVAWVAAALVVVAGVVLVRERVAHRTLMLAENERATQAAHGTWRILFNAGGTPVVLWLVALLALGAVGVPYAFASCRRLPERGWLLARPLGLLLTAWLTWMLVSLRVVEFGRGAIAIAFGVVAVGAATIAARERREMRAWIRSDWRLVLVGEAVCWMLFTAVLLIRWANPDLWHPVLGGEKPMDVAYLEAVVKSTSFPPYDPWFAGGSMNYYYFGFVLVGVVVKAVGIVPAVAYNLALPTLVLLLAGSVFSTTAGLAAPVGGALERRRVAAVGVVGVVLVAVIGNLGELRVLRSAIDRAPPVEWWYWNASRLIAHPAGEAGPINEFPAFTYLYGDLHAHAIALPFLALLLALLVALVRSAGEAWSSPGRLVRLLLVALTLGALWVTNSWDVPAGCVVVAGAVALARIRLGRGRAALVSSTGPAVAEVVGVIAVAYALFLPFHLRYRSVAEGVERWTGSRTSLADYVTIHGIFLAVIAAALVVRLWTSSSLGPSARSLRLAVRTYDRIRRRRELETALVHWTQRARAGRRLVLVAALAVVALLGARNGVAALGLALAALCLLGVPARRRRGRGAEAHALRRFLSLLVLLGVALTVAVEYAVMARIDVGRVNTVFKLLFETWLLWAIAAAVSLGYLYRRLSRLPRPVAIGLRAAAIVLVACGLLYPALAVPAKIRDRFDTSVGRGLDGMAFLDRAVLRVDETTFPLAGDGEMLRWIQENVDGSPLVAEINTRPTLYGWGNRYAMFTGNPSIVGWDYHQRQQRPWQSEEIAARIDDVQELYATVDPARAYELLTRYGAQYVVVGQLEQVTEPGGDAKWAEGEGRLWQLVHETPGVRLFRVLPG
jgi:YYY domain-containing protein